MSKLFDVLKSIRNNRKIERIPVQSNLATTLNFYSKMLHGIVKDYSYTGFGIQFNQDEISESLGKLADTKLSFPNQEFKGEVVYSHILPGNIYRIGFRVASEESILSFGKDDASWDLVKDPETVRSIFDDLVFKGPEAPLKIRQKFAKGIAIPTELTNTSMICELIEEGSPGFDLGEVEYTFDLFQTCHKSKSRILKKSDRKIEIQLQPVLARLLLRETMRIRKDSRDYKIRLMLKTNLLQKTFYEYEVFDYSEHGISLLDPKGELSLPRNLNFDEAIIQIEGIGEIKGFGSIRNYSWNSERGAFIAGFYFEPKGEPHITNWHNFILKARYPSLDFDYRDEDHKKIWDLFKDSGYLDIKDPSGFDDVYDYSQKTWLCLSKAGSKLSRRILIRENERILAHLQMDRLYPHTWYMHHLAIAPDVFKTISNDIYAVTSDVFFAEKSMFVLTLTDIKKKWNQKNYYDFIKNYPFPEHHDTKSFHLFEIDLEKKFNFTTNAEIVVSQANKYNLKTIQNFLKNNLPAIVNDAYSYSDDLLLEKFNEEANRCGLVRKRLFWVAKKENSIVGFAQLEVSLSGINILSYFDMIYIYFTQEVSPSERENIRDMLLATAIDYYKSIGKTKATAILDNVEPTEMEKTGLKYICEDVRWISITSISKKYQAYTKRLYGNLILRREKIRKKNVDK